MDFPSAADRLKNPEAVLSRGDLAELGWTRTAIDAIFRKLPVIAIEGVRKPMVRVRDYQELLGASTYAGDKVRA